jgi:hypothetical protein
MKIQYLMVAAFFVLVPIVALAVDDKPSDKADDYATFDPATGKVQPIPPELLKEPPEVQRPEPRFAFERKMAFSGHGALFDAEGSMVKLDQQEALEFQQSILNVLLGQEKPKLGVPEKTASELTEIASAALKEADAEKDFARRAAVTNIAAKALAWRLPDAERSEYVWRLDYIGENAIRIIFPHQDELAIRLSDRLSGIVLMLFGSDYMQECISAGVPIPPDFSSSSRAWAYQGDLATRMISGNSPAQVWTWASPSIRGACLALPRGVGEPGDLVGIICQSAFTGAACFWDNLPRERMGSVQSRMGWSNGSRLSIASLQDASMLSQNCTSCHRGNNVFLTLPDDPTWCKLLRRGNHSEACPWPVGANAQNLTLKSDDFPSTVLGGRPHRVIYFPISSPERASTWVNPVSTGGCMAGCHLNAQVNFSAPPNSMPPACSRGSQGVSGCY